MPPPRKKLIEVALPLAAINAAAAREKSIRHGHPSTLHLWWARRPLAAARAVLFAQMVDDPGSWPELFPTAEAQEEERKRLFDIIEELVKWENTTNEKVLQTARKAIRESWARTCAEHADHPRAAELFDPSRLPAFHDPFAGGGALPLEAGRLGLEAHASDLNPVAVLINKAMIEIPPRFAGRPPVNPDWQATSTEQQTLTGWTGARGLAEDVRYYGRWMREEAAKRIGHLYPQVEVTQQMTQERPDLKPYQGRKLTVIAWLWARTVTSPNPAFREVAVPLASTFVLSTRKGKEAYVEPVLEGPGYRFTIKVGVPPDLDAAKAGTKLSRGANFRCVMSDTPIAGDYIKAEGKAGRLGARLMAIVAEGDRGRVYLVPTAEHEAVARQAKPMWRPEVAISGSTQYMGVKPYGMNRFDHLFTDRQLVALSTFSDLITEAMACVKQDAALADLPNDGRPLRDGGTGVRAYTEAVAALLGLSVSRQTNRTSSLNFWNHLGAKVEQVFARQALSMVWDFCEANPFSDSSGNFVGQIGYLSKVIAEVPASGTLATAIQQDATTQSISADKIISTDPPYYDNIPYADLSDFFYVWLRRSLKQIIPELFRTLVSPKTNELVAFAYRHDGKVGAETFFLRGMTKAMRRLAEQTHPAFPVTIYYAFRQAEKRDNEGAVSTGWETFLDAVIRVGFSVTGTWPVRTEYTSQLKTKRSALASSIVLVCRKRPADAPAATRREFMAALKAELPPALARLQAGNIAPVDLAQAAIGPGMAVYTRYARVLDAAGKPVSVREALALINHTLDETLAEQEGEFDADSRWALAFFEQHGFGSGEYGVAETLSKAKNTSVGGLVEAGIVKAEAGTVRLLRPADLPTTWDPTQDGRLVAWEMVHHLIRMLERGEEAAAELVAKLGGARAGTARELCYRLYNLCERKQWAGEALSYNGLVQSWPEISRLAQAASRPRAAQDEFFGEE